MSRRHILKTIILAITLFLIALLVGFIFKNVAIGIYSGLSGAAGVIIASACYSHLCGSDGEIVINYSDPKKDVYRIELGIPFGEIDRRKIVIFKVEKEK